MEPLSEILRLYYQCNLKIRNDATRRKYDYALANLREAIGHEPTRRDLSDENVARMMSALVCSGRSVVTANDRRRRIHALWNWMAKRGMVQVWPTTPQYSEPRRIPHAWTIEQLERLMQACAAQRGTVATIPASLWWVALHSVLWDTGERITAVLQLPWSSVDLSTGWVTFDAVIRKGQTSDEAYLLAPDTLELLRRIQRPQRLLVLPWPGNRHYLWLRYERVLQAASLPCGRKHKFHAIRRSVASHLKRLGANAQEAMGHSDGAVTQKYLDPRICGREQISNLLPRIAKSLPRDQNGDEHRRRAQ